MPTRYICNVFSIGMAPQGGLLDFLPISTEKARTYILFPPIGTTIVHGIGHEQTARLANQLLMKGLSVDSVEIVRVARISFEMQPGDDLIFCQYIGPRLPEGATELPEGAAIRWYYAIYLRHPVEESMIRDLYAIHCQCDPDPALDESASAINGDRIASDDTSCTVLPDAPKALSTLTNMGYCTQLRISFTKPVLLREGCLPEIDGEVQDLRSPRNLLEVFPKGVFGQLHLIVSIGNETAHYSIDKAVTIEDDNVHPRFPVDEMGTYHKLPSWRALFDSFDMIFDLPVDLRISLSYANQRTGKACEAPYYGHGGPAAALLANRSGIDGALDGLGIPKLAASSMYGKVATCDYRSAYPATIGKNASPSEETGNPTEESGSPSRETGSPSSGREKRSPGLELMQEGFDEYMAREGKNN